MYTLRSLQIKIFVKYSNNFATKNKIFVSRKFVSVTENKIFLSNFLIVCTVRHVVYHWVALELGYPNELSKSVKIWT